MLELMLSLQGRQMKLLALVDKLLRGHVERSLDAGTAVAFAVVSEMICLLVAWRVLRHESGRAAGANAVAGQPC